MLPSLLSGVTCFIYCSHSCSPNDQNTLFPPSVPCFDCPLLKCFKIYLILVVIVCGLLPSPVVPLCIVSRLYFHGIPNAWFQVLSNVVSLYYS
ncbi:hypothetical protein FKM82_018752 [Ascaphus truei]